MLVDVTCRPAELFEFRVKCGILDDGDGKLPVNFKPLGSLAPLGDIHFRCHVIIVASSAKRAMVVKRTHVAVLGFHYVVANDSEVIERNA